MRRTFLDALKACAQKKDLFQGNRIHADIRASGLLEKEDACLGNALLSMYAKCGALARAQEVFDTLAVRNTITWNALIAGYAQHGHGQEALGVFHRMQSQGFSPDACTYSCALKACGMVRELGMGKQIHDDIVSQGLLKDDVVLGNALVDMYAKCGVLLRAQEVFDTLPVRNAISWNALIAGYTQHGQGREALGLFQRMRSLGISPDASTYTCVLKACGIVKDVGLGNQLHDDIVSRGLLKRDIVLGGALVDMHAKCGALLKAQQVFDTLPVRDTVTWTALIAGYAQHGRGQEALACFQRMRSQGVSPNATTYACVLKACGILQDVGLGKQIHDDIVSQGLLKKDVVLGRALVDMYAKCGAFSKAQEVFDTLSVRDVFSWTALIAGYVQHGQGQEALDCFQQMRAGGVLPDAFTYACVLKACGIVQDVGMGNRIHDDIVSQGLLKKDIVLGGALVDMHAKCGALSKAQEVINTLPVQDAISWNALIAGYAQHGQGQEALDCFQRMRDRGVSPDAFTYACVLKACGIVQDVGMGNQIHDGIVSHGLLKKDDVLGGALVDMHVKCGALSKAQETFDDLPVKNALSWTALIAGYAQHGQGQAALACFQRMRSQGISPNAITFLNVLNACSHSGLIDEGQMWFDSMTEKHGIVPTVKHYTCIVDLFGRASLVEKTMRVIRMMPLSDHLPVWSALLGSCQKWGDVKLGKFAFERAVQLDESCATLYVLMRNIYAAAGMQEEADNVERMRTCAQHCIM